MNNNHFNVIVIGDNPDNIMEKYDKKKKVKPYIVYEFAKAEEYRKEYIKIYEEAAKQLGNDNKGVLDSINLTLSELKEKDDISFYLELTNGYEIDQTTGNAVSNENPNGKYDTYSIGKNWALPLITNDGKDVYTAYKKDIDFSKIHMANTLPYQIAWEVVVENRKPTDAEEERIYENMKNRTAYFQQFKDKETYIKWSSSFWAYAFVDEDSWTEFSGGFDEQLDWVSNFYDRFIKGLPDDTKITIYECSRY